MLLRLQCVDRKSLHLFTESTWIVSGRLHRIRRCAMETDLNPFFFVSVQSRYRPSVCSATVTIWSTLK